MYNYYRLYYCLSDIKQNSLHRSEKNIKKHINKHKERLQGAVALFFLSAYRQAFKLWETRPPTIFTI
jgi:hypothetical protein